jgi:ATP-binding cassette subfamily B multidrug efflux pump
MSETTGKAFDYKLFKRVLKYVKPYKSLFILTGILTIVLSFMAPLRTLLVQKALDNYVLAGDAEGLTQITLLILMILIVNAFLDFGQKYTTNLLGQSVVVDMRKQLFQHILSFKMKYFDKTPIGSLVTRVTSDIQTITDIFSEGILVIISDILQLIIALVFMYYTNATLANITLIPVPLVLIATFIFKNIIKKAFQDVRVHVSAINTFIQEHVTGMNIVQIFNREKEEMNRFEKVNKGHRDGWIKTVWANAVFFPVVEILSATSLGLLIWWGAKGVIQGVATIGDMVAFILYVNMLYRPIRQLADRFNTLQLGMVSAERVFKILDTEEHIANNGSYFPEKLKGEIEFKNVIFSYDDKVDVLKNVSFHLPAGNCLALVGATGAGKTSIINVLTRFYETKSGLVTIDGVDIKEYDLNELRRICAVVLQDVFLFNDSIYNNVTLGRDSITKEEVIEAAKAIGVHDFVSNLPDGYDYQVKERGALLSSGQRQLLAFLRAYLYNPQVLILDEATSSIDTQSEILIQNAIETLTKGRTSIIIAHRLSTIQKANEILVLDKGEIVERGSHESLLQNKGYYHKLHNYQTL